MCVFKDRTQPAQLAAMTWKVIRLELASSWEFPRGSAGRSYLIRLPLTDEGAIDTATLASQPARATVRRYWANEADMIGNLVPTPQGYAAAWHDALCLPINRDVKVNELAPLDLRHLFGRPPSGCAAEGAWRRLAQMCVPGSRGDAGKGGAEKGGAAAN